MRRGRAGGLTMPDNGEGEKKVRELNRSQGKRREKKGKEKVKGKRMAREK